MCRRSLTIPPKARANKFIIPNDIPLSQDVETTFYPKAGDPNPIVRIGIADVYKNSLVPNVGKIPKLGERLPPSLLRLGDNAKFVDLAAYKPDDLLVSRVAWSPDSRAVVFQAQNREQTYLDFLTWPKLDGPPVKLFRDTTKAWVEDLGPPRLLKGGAFLVQSERTGWKHVYRGILIHR